MQERPRVPICIEDKIRIVGENHHPVKSFVIIGNALVRAASRLTLTEYRILRYAMSALLKEDTEFQILRISIKDMAKKIGIAPSHYSRIFDAVKSLYNKSIQMPPEIENSIEYDREFRWFTELRKPRHVRDAEKGFIDIRFSDTISEFLINIKNGNFTEIRTLNLFSIGSIHGSRLYELIMNWNNPYSDTLVQSPPSICIKELRRSLALSDYFDSEDLHSDYRNFRRVVLKHAVESINDNTDIYVMCESVKSGKSVKHLKFYFGKQKCFNDFQDFKNVANAKNRNVRELRK